MSPIDEIIPDELWNPEKVNEVIKYLQKAVLLPRRRKEIFVDWAKKVGVKMTKEQIDFLVGRSGL